MIEGVSFQVISTGLDFIEKRKRRYRMIYTRNETTTTITAWQVLVIWLLVVLQIPNILKENESKYV